MSANKILYVDDEAMALKYFQRLVEPVAPVITAGSVEEGRRILEEQGMDIAVLVTDQRMPGEQGNALLKYAKQHHPAVVRMLTTAYSDLGDAVEAINRGEIFRYITKPWELEALKADLRNALEMAGLRRERDALLRDKLMVQQNHLMAQRLAGLATMGTVLLGDEARSRSAVLGLARCGAAFGVAEPSVDWARWDQSDVQSAEASRMSALGLKVQTHLATLEPDVDVAQWVGHRLGAQGTKSAVDLLGAPVGNAPTDAEAVLWAGLLHSGGALGLEGGNMPAEQTLVVASAPEAADAWLHQALEWLAGHPH
ncbi:response regulator [Hydrogenophaga sp. 5NK40-0174]|uniref:response regulator n=1 Tax=Hydrogenophaga sp. 5NK40-0174 TaxID=3127649 RepID=UPI00310A020D